MFTYICKLVYPFKSYINLLATVLNWSSVAKHVIHNNQDKC